MSDLPPKTTFRAVCAMSAKCHKRTLSVSSEPALFSLVTLDLAKLAKNCRLIGIPRLNFNQATGPFGFCTTSQRPRRQSRRRLRDMSVPNRFEIYPFR